jgi:uncharacterized RDD family membrane protein YckC
MTPEQWQRIMRICDAALVRRPGERPAFLAEACQGDEALRHEVDALLAEALRDTDFLRDIRGANQPLSDATTRGSDIPTLPRGDRERETPFSPGHVFGPYRIERLLGRGGMGEVYAAEELDSGRRLALKVLRHAMLGGIDRARFLREGRLAASISHPHVVYIFGSAEIDGTPVIAMELVAGGTLQDLVQRRGSLPHVEAVDLILQVIAGLEAAYIGGIMHRDVKPSNCFRDTFGRVKVGDFGLSISTLSKSARTLTGTGMFVGTPAFAAPEQLRGEALDVRSDIYAVGATLFYMLTGQAPIEETNMMRLVARVIEEPSPSPRTIRPDIPKGLATVVQHSLAKKPAQRIATYSDLATALKPFSSEGMKPAAIGLRFAAGSVDFLLLEILISFIVPFVMRRFGWALGSLRFELIAQGVQGLICVAYFGLLEGLWNQSLGKRLCGLRIINADGGRVAGDLAWRRALTFTLLMMVSNFFMIPLLLAALVISHVPLSPELYASLMDLFELPVVQRFSTPVSWSANQVIWATSVVRLLPLGGLALIFVTARRRNRYAALHDFLTRTRVVQNPDRRSEIRRTGPVSVEVPTGAAHIGEFVLLDNVGMSSPVGVRVGYDPKLARCVWIHSKEPGSPPLPAWRRDLDRVSRVRWLAGRRTTDEAWDVYEAVPGRSLVAEPRADRATVWSWLRAIAVELSSGLADGSLPDVSVDQIWIGADGRVCLLEWPGRRVDTGEASPVYRITNHIEEQRFLLQVARSALHARTVNVDDRPVSYFNPPLPVSGSVFLGTLSEAGFTDARAVADATDLQSRQPTKVSRGIRISHLVICALATYVVVSLMLPLVAHVVSSRSDAGTTEQFLMVVGSFHVLCTDGSCKDQMSIDERLKARDVYIRGRFQKTLEEAQLTSDSTSELQREPLRSHVERIMRNPPPSPAELAQAERVLHDDLTRWKRSADDWMRQQRAASQLGLLALAAALLGCILSPVLFRGGLLLHSLRIDVVTINGEPESRPRALLRGLVVWVPIGCYVAFVALRVTPMQWLNISVDVFSYRWSDAPAIALVGLVIFIGGGLFSAVRPTRGIQDWIVGTWLVPR